MGSSTAGVGTKQMFWREKTHFGAEQYLVLSGPSFFNPQGLSFHKFLMASALQNGWMEIWKKIDEQQNKVIIFVPCITVTRDSPPPDDSLYLKYLKVWERSEPPTFSCCPPPYTGWFFFYWFSPKSSKCWRWQNP